MKRLNLILPLILLLAMAAAPSLRAANIWASYTTQVMYYESVDAHNRPITLSALLYIPDRTQRSDNLLSTVTYPYDVSFIMLDCHPTIASDAESATGASPLIDVGGYMCAEGALVVCPDYIGYGITAEEVHPYLVETLTARNCIDCELAAIAQLREEGLTFAPDYYTIVTGYSQGGAVAMACHKYIENNLSQPDQDIIRFHHSVCGDGPYSLTATMQTYAEWDELAYPCVLPMLLQGLKDAYDDGCMRSVQLSDYLVPAVLQSDVLELVRGKGHTAPELNDAVVRAVGSNRFSRITTEAGRDPSTNAGKCLKRALAKNDLTEGWQPRHPIYLFHYRQDEVVPFSNCEAALSAFAGNPSVHFVDCEDAYRSIKSDSFFWSLGANFSLGVGWQYNHSNCGTVFYVYLFSRNMRG